jgi:hypothetical protein
MTIELAEPVLIAFEELQQSNNLEKLFPRLLNAFGEDPECLGIVLISMQSEPSYSDLRKTVLSYASYLAALPSQELQELESHHSKYVVGWSHGKEKLKSGTADTRKGPLQIGCFDRKAAFMSTQRMMLPERQMK